MRCRCPQELHILNYYCFFFSEIKRKKNHEFETWVFKTVVCDFEPQFEDEVSSFGMLCVFNFLF